MSQSIVSAKEMVAREATQQEWRNMVRCLVFAKPDEASAWVRADHWRSYVQKKLATTHPTYAKHSVAFTVNGSMRKKY